MTQQSDHKESGSAASAKASDESRGSLWEFFSKEVESCGAVLFDMEVPTSRFGTIRIFIRTPSVSSSAVSSAASSSGGGAPDRTAESQQGVTLELCARVSKRLSALMESDRGAELGFDNNDWSLEVSSPGINRTLRRPEHFAGAIGERIRVRFVKSGATRISVVAGKSEESASNEAKRIRDKGVVTGKLVRADLNELTVLDDSEIVEASIPLRECREARVDFLF